MNHFEIVTAVLIGILSVARTARLIAYDAYPPMAWLRVKWDDTIGEDGWGALIHCQYCMTPYLATGMAAWFALSDGNGWWWAINGIWGLSYLSAIVVSYDQPPD